MAPAERFSVRAIDTTGVFCRECDLSEPTSALVHAFRLVRVDFLLDAFFAIALVLPDTALPVSVKQHSIRKLVSELFEEGPQDVMVKMYKCQAPSNNLTCWRRKTTGRRTCNNNAKLLNCAPKALMIDNNNMC
jgi:hypothetical protein